MPVRVLRAGARAGLRGGRVALVATGRGSVAVARGVGRWSRRPGGRFAVPALAIGIVVLAMVLAGALLVPHQWKPRPTAAATPEQPGASASPSAGDTDPIDPVGPLTGPSGSPLPAGDGYPQATPAHPADALNNWAQGLSAKVGISTTALKAYGYAQLVSASQLPGCHLAWTTLAGIGKVESDNAREGGATLAADGKVLPPIIGVALNGTNGNQLVKDTDGGTLDGDTVYDHAVGPMQFLPATWQQYQIDADQDGERDPNDLNDAALAAANYLCARGGDLSTVGGWWKAILSYNNLQSYGQNVFTAANDYGIKSRSAT